MPASIRDSETTRARLTQWCSERLGQGSEVNVVLAEGPATTGYSHETIIFDATWTHVDSTVHRRLIARVEPSTHTVFLDGNFHDEYRVAEILATNTDLPVPAVYGYEPDPRFLGAAFYVMAAVEGIIPPDSPPYTFGGWLVETPPEDQAQLWWSGLEAMAAVHAVDWERLGLEFVARGTPGHEPQLNYYQRYLQWVGGENPDPSGQAALRWLRENRPDDEALGFCWGDSRIGNQIFRDLRCVALLDWEMAAIADPEQDLAWFVYMDRVFADGLGMPRPAGFPSAEETNARYEELTGRVVRNPKYYEVFAAFRFALILTRVMQLMKEAGTLPEGSDENENFAMRLLEVVLQEAGATGQGR
jgi:aminoglycoside phosphotransferase (APT) family kinase protein